MIDAWWFVDQDDNVNMILYEWQMDELDQS